MGYSNWWKLKEGISKEKMDKIIVDFSMVGSKLEHVIEDLNITEDQIFFNGKGETCSPMVFKIDGIRMNDCKTMERPYNLGVVVLLIIAKKYLGEKIEIKLDGDKSLKRAEAICNKELGYQLIQRTVQLDYVE